MQNINQDSEYLSKQFPGGYFVPASGGPMSIRAAVNRGFVYRSNREGFIVVNGNTMLAEGAIAVGMIDKAAADYITTLEGTDKPAPFTREDMVSPEPEFTSLDTAKTLMDAVSRFFLDPSLTAKHIAIEALSAHMEAAEKKVMQPA